MVSCLRLSAALAGIACLLWGGSLCAGEVFARDGLPFEVNANDPAAMVGSLFWRPYVPDKHTTALFHFDSGVGTAQSSRDQDQVAPQVPGSGDLLDALGAETSALDGLGGEEEAHPAKGAPVPTGPVVIGKRIVDAVTDRPRGLMSGACRVVEEGWVGAGLAFGPAQGFLHVPIGYTNPLKNCETMQTVEFWVKLEAYPEAPQTLLCLGVFRPEVSAQLIVAPDGALSLAWLGKPLPRLAENRSLNLALAPGGGRLPVGEWTHVALARGSAWPNCRQMRLYVDGHYVQDHSPLELRKNKQNMRFALIGNPAPDKEGLRATIDEVRVSSTLRHYYPLGEERHWARAVRRPVVAAPHFRRDVEPLLALPFDRSTAAAPGSVAVSILQREAGGLDAAPRYEYQEGVAGSALVLADAQFQLGYEFTAPLTPERGTIAFWFRPLNWDNYTRWFKSRGWKMRDLPVLALAPPGGGKAGLQFKFWHTPFSSEAALHPGRWYHLSLVWEGTRREVYLDGQPAGIRGAWWWDFAAWPANERLCLSFLGGARRTLIDEVMVFDQPLAPEEIGNLLATWDPQRTPAPLPRCRARLRLVDAEGGAAVQVEMQALLVKDNTPLAGAAVRIAGGDGAEALAQQAFSFDEFGWARGAMKIGSLPFGTHPVRIALQNAGGEVLETMEQSIEREKPPWLGNRIGFSDKVMPEWEPVTLKEEGGRQKAGLSAEASAKAEGGAVVGISLREIHFSACALPKRVISVGEDILAGPVSLVAKAGGEEVALAPVAEVFRASTKGEVRADLSGRLVAPDWEARIESYIEFDGMMWFDVTLAPKEGKAPRLDDLRVTIPYTEQNAELIHWDGGHRQFKYRGGLLYIGELDRREGVVFKSNDKGVTHCEQLRGNFIPYLSLAGPERGMAWFAENDRGWTQSDEVPAVVVERKGNTVNLILHIISSPVTLDAPRTFSFGLHPTPVKPMPKRWRMTPSWGVFSDSFAANNLKGPHGETNFHILPQNEDWDDALRRAVTPTAKNVDTMRMREEGFEKEFRKTYGRDPEGQERCVPGLYQNMQHVTGWPANTRPWHQEWFGNQKDGLLYTQSLNDFLAWAWNEWLRRDVVKGIYVDDAWPRPQLSFPGTVTYRLPDGHVQPGYQWRGYRERFRRIRQTFHDNGLRPYMCVHCTRTYIIPYISFFDVVLSGEYYRCHPRRPKQTFFTYWSLGYQRYFNAAKFGWVPDWCCNTIRMDKDEMRKFPAYCYRQDRALVAGLALHDIIWTTKLMPRYFPETLIRKLELRLSDDTEFVPYWDLQGLAAVEPQTVKLSAWKTKQGCLAIVVNTGEARATAKVQIDCQALGLGVDEAAQVEVEDVDPKLLMYFDSDPTTMERPRAAAAAKEGEVDLEAIGTEDEGLGLEVTVDELSPAERRAQDPDRAFSWEKGALSCPVRRHDYRLFLFKRKE